MGFQDRRYRDADPEGGAFRRALRRIFVEGDDFYSWSLPLFRVFGIGVRIHILYVVFILAQLIFPFERSSFGFAFTAFSMATLFVLVLLHEFGHCFACRWVGGEADRILMWPLGGLAFCRPPHDWKKSLITTLGGPAVNVALVPVLGAVVFAMGAGWDVLIFNPLDVRATFADPFFVYESSYLKYFAFSAYLANWALLAFNMLLVMFPMDAGRVLQEILWSRMGYKRSMRIAVNTGLALAVIVGMFALLKRPPANNLFAIALFAGITCFTERRRLAMVEDEPEYEVGSLRQYGYGPRPTLATGETRGRGAARPDRAYQAAARRQEEARALEAEVDRIFDKIRQSGMSSLTRKERGILDRHRKAKLEQGGAGGAGGAGRD